MHMRYMPYASWTMDGESSLVSHGDTGTYTLASWYTPH